MRKAKAPSTSAEYRVALKPVGGNVKLEKLLAKAQQIAPELETILQKQVPGARLCLRRAEEFPWHHLLTLLLQIDWKHAAHIVEDATITGAVSEMVRRLGQKLDASVETAKSLPETSQDVADPTFAKKTSATKSPAKKESTGRKPKKAVRRRKGG